MVAAPTQPLCQSTANLSVDRPVDLPADVLDILTSPDLSLREVAAHLGLPLDRLCLHLATAEGLELLTGGLNLCVLRARFTAASLLPKALRTLSHTLDDHDEQVRAKTATDTHHERARRAANLLTRIANFNPRPLSRPSSIPADLTPRTRPPQPSVAPLPIPAAHAPFHAAERPSPQHARTAPLETPRASPHATPPRPILAATASVIGASPPPQCHTLAPTQRAGEPTPPSALLHARHGPAATLIALAGAPFTSGP